MSSTRTLAARIFSPAGSREGLREGLGWDALRIAAANILLILCAQIAVPLPFTPVPVTGQTLGVMLIAVFFGARRGAIAAALYLFEGAAGLPVFQPYGAPGAARLLGPTAGYLWAYPAAVYITGWLAERIPMFDPASNLLRPRRTLALAGALLPGQMLILACGCAWLASTRGWAAAISLGVLPFLPGEVIKIATVLAVTRGAETATRS
jgi:biotin transport system substrate-specific component